VPVISEPGNAAWIAALPKVELHIHLEGAVPLRAQWEIASKYGHPESFEQFADRFEYQDFEHFLDIWAWRNTFIRELEDFTHMAEAFSRELAAQGVTYAEAFFSPSDFASTKLSSADIAGAIRTGLDRAGETKVALVADLVRGRSPHAMLTTLDELSEVREQAGIIGIGLGGDEARHPAGLSAGVWEQAAARGFNLTAHAGEAAGPESVLEAIRTLGVSRIGHGVRIIEDQAAVEIIVTNQIALELCPWSNVRTGVISEINAHPVRQLFDAGVLVTINSDDPALFQTSLNQEYLTLMETFGFSRAEVLQVAQNAATAAWASPTEKEHLATALTTAAAL